jgi:hypothetical protein
MAASLPSNTAGQYYPPPSTSTAGVAQVSSRYRNQPQSQAEVLLHETQHGVAGVTKEIPQGTNPDTIRSFTAELENRAGSYRTNARTESDNLMDRMDNMESYFANEGPEALRVYEQIVDPLDRPNMDGDRCSERTVRHSTQSVVRNGGNKSDCNTRLLFARPRPCLVPLEPRRGSRALDGVSPRHVDGRAPRYDADGNTPSGKPSH